VRTIEPPLGERELRLVVQLARAGNTPPFVFEYEAY